MEETLAEHKNPDIHVSIIVKAIQVKNNYLCNFLDFLFLVKALIEMCGGNHKNQTVAINSQVIDSLNLILLKGLNMTTVRYHDAVLYHQLDFDLHSFLNVLLMCWPGSPIIVLSHELCILISNVSTCIILFCMLL